MTKEDSLYFDELADGVMTHYEELSQLIKENAEGYSFERIYKIDLSILLLALYEIIRFIFVCKTTHHQILSGLRQI